MKLSGGLVDQSLGFSADTPADSCPGTHWLSVGVRALCERHAQKGAPSRKTGGHRPQDRLSGVPYAVARLVLDFDGNMAEFVFLPFSLAEVSSRTCSLAHRWSVTCSSTWLGDPPPNSARRPSSGTSWDYRVQTYCQGIVLGGLTMDLWSLAHFVFCPCLSCSFLCAFERARTCPCFSVVKTFPFRSFWFMSSTV